jgi:hypothetical protein
MEAILLSLCLFGADPNENSNVPDPRSFVVRQLSDAYIRLIVGFEPSREWFESHIGERARIEIRNDVAYYESISGSCTVIESRQSRYVQGQSAIDLGLRTALEQFDGRCSSCQPDAQARARRFALACASG